VQGGNSLLSLLTSVMSTVRGGQMMSDADAKASEIMAKRFEIENQQAQAKMEADAAKEERDWQRRLQEIDYGNASGAKYREPRNIDPLSPEGRAAQQELERFKAGLRPQGGGNPTEKGWSVMDTPQGMMRVNSLTGAVEPLNVGGKPLLGKAGEAPVQDPKAAAASQARELLAKLQGKLSDGSVSTGPLDQYMPGKGGQEFESTIAQLTQPFQALTKIPGNGTQSDADLKALMSGLPSLNKYEDVNKGAIESLVGYINKLSPPEQAAAMQQIQGAQAPAQTPQAPQGQPTQTATNPQTGERIGLINGQWVPL